MIRLSILVLFLVVIWIYAFKDYYVSLCGLIVMTVLTQSGEMPQTIGGIQGLNPWNVSIAIITACWLVQRKPNIYYLHVPRIVWAIMGSYIAIITVSHIRLMLDLGSLPVGFHSSPLEIISDTFINPMKYLWAAILIFDGCTNRQRAVLGLGSILLLGTFYGLFVVKVTPLEVLFGGDVMRYRHRIDKEIGLHPNDMAKVLMITFWGIIASLGVWKQYWLKFCWLVAAAAVLVALGLCFSRAAYLTFVLLGLMLAVIRYHRMLLIGPVILVILVLSMPGITARMQMGWEDSPTGESDWDSVTAGRSGTLWPPVIDDIYAQPIIGYGRLAILRTAAHDKIAEVYDPVPTSPHNGYLENLHEHGLVGLAVVVALFGGIMYLGVRLLWARDPLLKAAGGAAFAAAAGCLITAMSGAMLLPDQGMLGPLCTFGICARVWSVAKIPGSPLSHAYGSPSPRPAPIMARPLAR
jgi:O-antigen ligase